MSTSETKPVVIDLQRISISLADDINNMLQYKAREKFDGYMEEFLERFRAAKPRSSDRFEEEFSPQRYHNVVFVSGRRGTGKTTFIRSVLTHAAKENHDCYPVALLDPTLVQTHESILMQVVAKIRDCTLHAARMYPQNEAVGDFHKCIEKMGEGLKLLSPFGTGPMQDSAWFLGKAFMNMTGGQNLEKSFHELVDKAAEILKKELLLIAFDDVDTDTSKAVEVMEVIRRYLTSPRLVVIITGDPALYSYITRRKRAEELGVNLKNDPQKRPTELVEHLEQQYLAKIFPVQFRIQLQSLDEVIRTAKGDKRTIVFSNDRTQRPVEDFFLQLFQIGLAISKEEAQKFKNFILREPLRTIVQIAKHTWTDEAQLKKSLLSALRDSYIGALNKEDIKSDGLSLGDTHPHTIGMIQFRLYKKYEKLETGFYCRPDGEIESFNSVQSILASLISVETGSDNFCLKAHKILHIMLAGPGACTTYVQYVRNTKWQDGFISYLGLEKWETISHLAAHFSPYYSDKKHSVGVGVVRTIRKRRGIDEKKLKERLDNAYPAALSVWSSLIDLVGEIGDDEPNSEVTKSRTYAVAAILASRHSMADPESILVDFVSVFCLLASMAEILDTPDRDAVERVLKRRISNHTYPPPGGDLKLPSEKGEDDPDPSEKILNTLDLTDLVNELWDWKSSVSCLKVDGSALLIGKIWTRLFYSLTNTSSQNPDKSSPLLGEAMEKFIWALINSFIVEECNFNVGPLSEKLTKILVYAENPDNTTRKIVASLIRLAEVIKGESILREYLPLSAMLISCPLIHTFLGPRSGTLRAAIKRLDDELLPSSPNVQGLAYISRLPIAGAFSK